MLNKARSIMLPLALMAWAAIAPGTASAETLYGCKNKTNGSVRIVDAGVACKNSEVPVSWSSVGIQGPAGPAGPAGPPGPKGQIGPAGPAGDSLVINAVVNPDGTLLVNDKPPEATLSVARTGPGAYLVSIGGLGSGCPLPIANAFAATAMYLGGGSCGQGSLTTTVQTLDGVDHPFGFQASGRGAPAAAPSAGTQPAAASARSSSSDWVMLPESNGKF